jgi:hypothetical protein
MSYQLQELSRCGRLPCRPTFIPKARLRGVRARGITFERKVGKVLRALFPFVTSGEWFEYHDARRSGVCQIDHYCLLPDRIILVECKLSESDEAWGQMKDLYAPILQKLWDLPVARVQATRHLRSGRNLLGDVREAKPGREALWQVLV